MRFAGWVCLVLAVGCLIAAPVLGILAVQQATEISAYHHARACPPAAAPNADCLQTVDGSVVAVTEFPGGGRISADYALDVRTAATTLHLTFSADSPMLGYAVDGAPAAVTMWRGVPVSVVTDGRSAVTTSVPETAFAGDLGNSAKCAGVGVFLLLGAWAIRRNRTVGAVQPITRPAVAATLCALFLGSVVVAFGGFALGGKPSRLGPVLVATGTALVLVIGLSVWLWLTAKRRISRSPVSDAVHAADVRAFDVQAVDAHAVHAPVPPAAPTRPQPQAPPRIRLHPASLARVLRVVSAAWLPPVLIVGVLFGVLLTSNDGPPARAFRHAPACVGETNLATCQGDFTAVINGVRTPANGRSSADVSYVTSDGAINQWGTFDGNSAVLARTAAADEEARTPLTVRVWRGSIIGAELGGSWHWTEGNPPGDTIPAVFLSVSFALLLLMVRLRVHRRVRSRTPASRRRILIDDLGQVAGAAGSVVLLAEGFWPGAILAVAVLLWLGLSARQSTQRRHATLAEQHAI